MSQLLSGSTITGHGHCDWCVSLFPRRKIILYTCLVPSGCVWCSNFLFPSYTFGIRLLQNSILLLYISPEFHVDEGLEVGRGDQSPRRPLIRESVVFALCRLRLPRKSARGAAAAQFVILPADCQLAVAIRNKLYIFCGST